MYKKSAVIFFIITNVFIADAFSQDYSKHRTLPVQSFENRTLRLGLCDFSSDMSNNPVFRFLDKYPQFVATHYDVYLDGSPSAERTKFLKERNPTILMFAYWNVFALPFEESPNFPEEMFMHDIDTGNRIVYTGYPGNFILNPASTFWREYSLARIQEFIDMGYDGIHLDDVWADLAIHGGPNFVQADAAGNIVSEPYKETPQWYSKQEFMENMKSFIAHIESHIEPSLTVYNGLNETPIFDEAFYLPAADGVVFEAPLVADWVHGWFRVGEDGWKAALQTFLDVPADKTISWVDYGPRENIHTRLYSLASYMLVMRENSAYMYTPQCWHLTYLPEWNVDYGEALNQPKSLAELLDSDSGVYVREFTNSMVVVNPDTANTKTFHLSREFYRMLPAGGNVEEIGGNGTLSFERITSVSIRPREGVIFVKKPVITGIEEKNIPKTFLLLKNYPNPFNPATTIRYQLPKAGQVTLTIYNTLGEEVRTLVNQNQAAGNYAVVWNGKSDTGEEVSSGVYLYKLKMGGAFITSRKMVFIK